MLTKFFKFILFLFLAPPFLKVGIYNFLVKKEMSMKKKKLK